MPGSPDLSGHSQTSAPIHASPSLQEALVLWLCCLVSHSESQVTSLSALIFTLREAVGPPVSRKKLSYLGRHPECCSLSPHATPQGPKPGWLANVPPKNPGGSMPVPHQPWKGKLHPTQAQPDATQCTRAPSRANTAAGPVFSSGSMRRRQRRRRKASVLRYSRWNFQPKSEAYSQPSPSASACLCCGREEAAMRERQGRIPRGKPGKSHLEEGGFEQP